MSRPRVGYRFMPSDEEIISYFLKHKMDGKDSLVNEDVHEIDLCKHEPWDLPSLCANEESYDQTWYFFCKREKKTHQRRTTKVGYWKSTGQDRQIKSKVGKKVIGTKKSLRFHFGRTPHGKQTEWTIHEYNSSTVLPHQTHFVLCKLMKKNSDKADNVCREDNTLGNQPSNNENDCSESLIAEVDQERSVSPNLGDSFHPREWQQLGQTHEEISSFINEYIGKSDGSFSNVNHNAFAGLRSSSAYSEKEQELADSFITDPYENINRTYANSSGSIFKLQAGSEVQDGHAVAWPKEYQRRQSVALSGTLPSLKHDENGREKILVLGGEISEEENLSAVVTSDTVYSINVLTRVSTESSSGSTTPGDYEIYANGQEYSSSSSTTPEQEVHFTGRQWPKSSGYSSENRSVGRSQIPRILSNQLAPKIQKQTTVHLSQNKSSNDSGKMKRLLVESEEDQKTVVAAESSKLRTFMSSLIRFESIPTSHNPPFLYIANVIVGLVLFIVICREMLIFH